MQKRSKHVFKLWLKYGDRKYTHNNINEFKKDNVGWSIFCEFQDRKIYTRDDLNSALKSNAGIIKVCQIADEMHICWLMIIGQFVSTPMILQRKCFSEQFITAACISRQFDTWTSQATGNEISS